MPTNIDPRSKVRHVAILGGGICGLTAAYRISQLRPAWKISLLEAKGRLGGVLKTCHHESGFLVENSADNFIANRAAPWAMQLCEEIGFADQITPTNTDFRRAVIWSDRKLHPVPEGFRLMQMSSLGAIARSRLLSWPAKLRMAMERFIPARNAGELGDPNRIADESLASFAKRRLGYEAFDKLIQPLVSGIYTADPQKLSMNAALPQFVRMEQLHGSIAASIINNDAEKSRRESGARYNQFWAPRDGMSSLVEFIAKKLNNVDIQLHASVTAIRRQEGKWSLAVQGQADQSCDGILACLPATSGSAIFRSIDRSLAIELESIEHASSSVVCLGYKKKQFSKPLRAFGCVVPASENRRVIAISFSSMKYGHRAPDDSHLLRIFVGGALQPELAMLPEKAIIRLAVEECAELLGARGVPTFTSVVRWPTTMPQYHLQHLDRVARIREQIANIPALEFESNALDGVGIPQRIRAGNEAAIRLIQKLTPH